MAEERIITPTDPTKPVIRWHTNDASMRSGTIKGENATVGKFVLSVWEWPKVPHFERNIVWGVFGGPRCVELIMEGSDANTFEAAKLAAERKVYELMGVVPAGGEPTMSADAHNGYGCTAAVVERIGRVLGYHPDGVLIEAAAAFVKTSVATNTSPCDDTGRDDQLAAALDTIALTPAAGPAGIAVKLSVLQDLDAVARGDEVMRGVLDTAADAVVRLLPDAGHAVPAPAPVLEVDELRSAARAVVVYNRALDGLKAAAVAPDIRTEFAAMLRADAADLESTTAPATEPATVEGFNAMVRAFDAAAPEMIPAVPTLAMVEAGAVAAGMTHETIRAAFAAMAAAHRRTAA